MSAIPRRERHRERKQEGNDQPRKIIRWRKLLEILPLGETEIRKKFLATGRLRPVPLGQRAIGFVLDEVFALNDELIAARDAALEQETAAPAAEGLAPCRQD